MDEFFRSDLRLCPETFDEFGSGGDVVDGGAGDSCVEAHGVDVSGEASSRSRIFIAIDRFAGGSVGDNLVFAGTLTDRWAPFRFPTLQGGIAENAMRGIGPAALVADGQRGVGRSKACRIRAQTSAGVRDTNSSGTSYLPVND